MPKIIDGNKEILTSGYGTGLTAKQKQSRAWVLDPQVVSTETVAAGNGSGNAVALSTTSTVSFVTTATNSTHVSLANGITGQVKIIVHKTRGNSEDLVITPANFAAGATLTSDEASRSVTLLFDGTNWQVIAGEITGTEEFAIGS
tara:strand:+ start:4035 stop:4469 length:435 start_codon:yes stop_codon:yes gene_type:complete